MSASLHKVGTALIVALLLAVGVVGRGEGVAPLSEADLVKLIELQVGDEAVIARLQKGGLGFPVDDAAIDRLRQSGASRAALDAVRKAGRPSAAGSTGAAVTYDGVLDLVRSGAPEDQILKQLAASPTTFTLDPSQVEALKAAGASPGVIEAMQALRNPASSGSDISDFAVVLDCSGSMKELTPDGTTKMDAARQVVARFINDIPDGKRLTFIVYGTRATNSEAVSCRDVQVVQTLSPLDAAAKGRLSRYITEIEPNGATPLSLAMQTAGEQLSGSRSLTQMVVITDGMETCGGNPAAVAADLIQKLELPHGLDVVGLGMASREMRAVQDIVSNGRGHYYNARNAVELDRALLQAKREARAVVAVEPGFVPLFNGRDLSGWVVDGNPTNRWTAEHGSLAVTGSGVPQKMNWLLTSREFTDFSVRFQFQLGRCDTRTGALESPIGHPNPASAIPSLSFIEDVPTVLEPVSDADILPGRGNALVGGRVRRVSADDLVTITDENGRPKVVRIPKPSVVPAQKFNVVPNMQPRVVRPRLIPTVPVKPLGERVNSGFVFRADNGEPFHLEMQIGNEPGQLTGLLFWTNNRQLILAVKPIRAAILKPDCDWNDMEVQLTGQVLRVRVNGSEIVNTDLGALASQSDALPGLSRTSGHIGFQALAGTVRYRNVRVRTATLK